MAYISRAFIKSRTELQVEIRGLDVQGEYGMQFVLYEGGYERSLARSYRTDGEANIIFDISAVTPGNSLFTVKRRMISSGREFSVGDPFYRVVPDDYTPQPEPDPTPRTQPMSKCRIDKIEIATDTAVTVKVTVDGYGKVDMRSITLNQADFGRDLVNVKISKDDYDLQTYGSKTFEMSYRLDGFYKDIFSMYGDQGLPLGTVELEFRSSNFWRSTLLLCVNEYSYRSYNGEYSTIIKPVTAGYSVAVASLSTVSRDWQLLINVFYYLSSTTEGALKMGSRASYIPRYGDVLTADMYNGLIDIARSCLDRIKYKYADGYWLNPKLPSKVYSGQIIPKNFINILGNAANEMSKFVQKQTNSRVEGVWR